MSSTVYTCKSASYKIMQQHTVYVEALPRLTLDQSMLLAASSLPLFCRRFQHPCGHQCCPTVPQHVSPVQKHSVLLYWPKMLRQPCLSTFNPNPSAHTPGLHTHCSMDTGTPAKLGYCVPAGQALIG